jgi:predicted dehydrogenase
VLSQTEDIANARLNFAGGCVANLTASRVSPERMRKIRLFQSDAYISIDFGTNKIVVMRREGELGADGVPPIRTEQLEFDESDALLAQDRSFAEAVRTRRAPEVTGEDGYRALDLALRIQDSIPPLEELE